MCYSFFHRREWKNNTFSDSLSAVYAAARIRVYAYNDHVSNLTEKSTAFFRLCFFIIQKAYTSIMMGRIIGLLFVSLYMNFPT